MRKIDGNGGQSFLGVNTTPDPIDIATVATPGVTEVVKNALASGKLYGDLTLTNVMELGEYAFNGAILTNVFLAGSLEILPNAVFKGSSITNLVLDLPNLTTVANGAFTSQTQIRRVELVTAFKDMVILTNIVAAAAAGTANLGENGYMVYDEAQEKNVWRPNNLRVYVSKKQWTPSAAETYDADTNPTGFFQGSETFTDKEKKLIAADPTLEKAFGVLITKGKKSGAEVVVRKAFLVHKPSIHDKSGTLISVR